MSPVVFRTILKAHSCRKEELPENHSSPCGQKPDISSSQSIRAAGTVWSLVLCAPGRVRRKIRYHNFFKFLKHFYDFSAQLIVFDCALPYQGYLPPCSSPLHPPCRAPAHPLLTLGRLQVALAIFLTWQIILPQPGAPGFLLLPAPGPGSWLDCLGNVFSHSRANCSRKHTLRGRGHMWWQAEGAGVVEPGEEKALGRPHSGLLVPKGGCKKVGEGLFTSICKEGIYD